MPDDDEIRVLYVGGVPRSGSTLSGLLFDKLKGHVAIGEVYYLFRYGLKLNNICGCGARFSACDFWQAVGEEAFGGWSKLDLEHALTLQTHVDRTPAVPALVSPWRFEWFERDLTEYRGILNSLYHAVLKTSGESVIVDLSKNPSTGYVLRGIPGLKLTCVQVVRDPRGVAYSHSKVVPLAPSTDASPFMPQVGTYKSALRWVTVNALVRALRRFGVPHLTIRYEDLTSDPIAQLRRVAEMQGQDTDGLESDCLTPAGLVMSPRHLLAGSRIRLHNGVMPIRLDEEWRDALPAGQRRLISAMTALSRPRYGY